MPYPAGNRHPKARSMASYWCSSLPFASLSTLKTLKNPLGTPNPAGTSYPNATSMASYGRSSLPFARPYTLKTLATLKYLLGTPLGTPNPAGTSYPKATSIDSYGRSSLPFARFSTLQTLTTLLGMPSPAGNRHPPRPDQWLLMGVQACRLPAFQRFNRLKILLARPAPQAHPWWWDSAL